MMSQAPTERTIPSVCLRMPDTLPERRETGRSRLPRHHDLPTSMLGSRSRALAGGPCPTRTLSGCVRGVYAPTEEHEPRHHRSTNATPEPETRCIHAQEG